MKTETYAFQDSRSVKTNVPFWPCSFGFFLKAPCIWPEILACHAGRSTEFVNVKKDSASFDHEIAHRVSQYLHAVMNLTSSHMNVRLTIDMNSTLLDSILSLSLPSNFIDIIQEKHRDHNDLNLLTKTIECYWSFLIDIHRLVMNIISVAC